MKYTNETPAYYTKLQQFTILNAFDKNGKNIHKSHGLKPSQTFLQLLIPLRAESASSSNFNLQLQTNIKKGEGKKKKAFIHLSLCHSM